MMKYCMSLAGLMVAAVALGQTGDARRLLDESGTTGGLIVHVNCGDGSLATAMAEAATATVVQGLDSDRSNVQQARQRFRSLPAASRMSAEHWTRHDLPYASNLVNLLIAQDADWLSTEEAMRVLSPGGTYYRQQDGEWKKQVKPAASGAGDWTHYQYDATNNPVGADSGVGLPRHFQWSGKPLWSAAHESMASLNAMVSAKGRVFYIIDEGPRASIQLPADWQLVARDAHNGIILWKKPLTQWLTRYWPWKSGPAQMPRKLIAIADRVYLPLDINGPLVQLNAATGERLQTYEGTGAAEEVIHTDGILLVQVDPDPGDMAELERQRQMRRHFNYDGPNRVVIDHDKAKRIVAIEAQSGRQLWTRIGPRVLPLTLASRDGNVVYHDGQNVVCLDLRTGAEKWKSEPLEQRLAMYSEDAPTLVLHKDAVLFVSERRMTALSISDGKTLWKSDWTQGDYRSPATLMLMNDLAWSMDITSARAPGTFVGRNPLTGQVEKQFDLPPFQGIGHHRCYKAKASGDFVLLSRSGVEYVNPTTQSYDENHWIRGACLYGILPANGMLYSTPHACACYIKGKLNGFCAMTPGETGPARPSDTSGEVIEKGIAFGQSIHVDQRDDDWPTYRHDFRRSGRTKFPVTSDLKQTWKSDVGGDLSSVTVAAGLVFVAQRDRNTVVAIDAQDGLVAWQYTAGGTVDSPPTIDRGRVYFGSADGSVYCLRASDGVFLWRTRVAPAERRVVAYGRVESAWPVHGSVLVHDGAVYCSAGRSSFLDGGINVVKLDPESGQVETSYTAYDLDAEGKQPPLKGSFDMDGALPDILSGDGERIFMRHLSFDAKTVSPREPAPHAFSPTGYLDDNWWHRTYWVYGDDTKGGYGGWWQAGNKLPAGRLLVHDDDSVYAFGRSFYAGMNAAQFGRGETYMLYSSEKQSGKEPNYEQAMQARRRGDDLHIDWSQFRTTPIKWSEELPLLVRAMVLADRTLFVAGPYGDAVRSMDSFEGKRGVRLAAVSADDGRLIANYEIDALPVFDALAAAGGQLFMSMKDGSVRCFGPAGTPLESALSDKIEKLPEELMKDDEQYREEVREKIGPARDAAPSRPRKQLKGESRESNFSDVSGGKVVASPLGYRLGADEGKLAFALKKLDHPITTRATWTFRMKAAEGFPNPPYYQNGFFIFGDGTKDEQLIKCGIQFVQGIATINQGPTSGKNAIRKPLEGDLHKVFEIQVSVDLEKQQVTMTTANQTLTAPLKRRLDSLTTVGFASWNSVTDFTEVVTKQSW